MIGAILGIVLGGAGGYVISKNASRFTGGVCPIMCNPKIAVPYFAFLGLLLGM